MSAHRPIRVMPPELALKIAAGEVVERPASAVKELIDNAVDAGARQIRIEIREAGLKLIRVTDDGQGIAAAELPLAFTSHATSKIAELDDLERLTTLGFRGEALPSIAAVSRIELRTRAEGEDTGAQIRLEFGNPVASGPCAAARGVRITVTDLFANVPARRKFVRSLRAEAGQIYQVVALYAIAQPDIGFQLSIDGRLSFDSPGSGRIADAFAAVYGADELAGMYPVEYEEHGVRIAGLVSSPALSRPTRSAIHVLVNGRPVQNRSLVFALDGAYSGYLMTGRHPLAAVHLQVAPEDIDPNIHPAKNEVRFAHEREVHGTLHRAVSGVLLAAHLQQREMEITSRLEPADAGDNLEDLPLPFPDAGSQPDHQPPLDRLPPMPALRVFGQTNQAFIIAEGPDGLYMIDQHAAHERVLFDQLDLEMAGGQVPSQPLLEPVSVDLEPGQLRALDLNRDLLERAGFAIDPFGRASCLVRAVPAVARGGGLADLVREVLSELENLPEPGAARERALAMMACKAAVKAGQTLEVEEMRQLVMLLEHTPRPATCPHGRPIMIHLSHHQLEREFGRR
jgi:DNA mismatch repair protein MutL